VRALAQRASGAATDIRKLIEKSGTEVSEGVNLVNAAGESLEEISVQVALINDTIGAIATASKTQAESLGEIKASVNQIDKITQMNAAMVEENTAVTHRLAGEASGLSELVRQFRLGGARPAGVGSTARPTPSPARDMIASLSKAFSRG